MRLLYKPLAIIASFISARVGRAVFRSTWRKIDEQPPPQPRSGEGSLAKVVGAKALEAGVMAGTAATVDRLFARFFHHLIGIWPKKAPEPDDD